MFLLLLCAINSHGMQFQLTKEFIDNLITAITDDNKEYVKAKLEGVHPADIAEILDVVNLKEAQYIYSLLDEEVATDVLVELDEDVRDKFLSSFSAKEIAEQIDNMDTDDAADLIQELPEERVENVLSELEDEEQASEIASLLEYDENSAGGLMAKEFISANINWTVREALTYLREQAQEISYVYTIYVVNDTNKLLGTLSLKSFLYAHDETKIIDLYIPDPKYVTVDTPAEEVANIMKKYDLVAIPVVNVAKTLLGRITIDDVVDIIQEEADKDYQMASGLSEKVESRDSVWLLTRARLPWLLVGLVGGILGSLVIGSFEEELALFPAMAFFIPLIAAMGGNVGVQSSAIIVQGLANNSLAYDSTFKKIVKELVVALINGLVLATIIFSYTLLLDNGIHLALTVSIALFAVIIFAGVFGTLVPIVLDKYNIDPALATGPFITTMNDIIGLLLYFTIGWLIYF